MILRPLSEGSDYGLVATASPVVILHEDLLLDLGPVPLEALNRVARSDPQTPLALFLPLESDTGFRLPLFGFAAAASLRLCFTRRLFSLSLPDRRDVPGVLAQFLQLLLALLGLTLCPAGLVALTEDYYFIGCAHLFAAPSSMDCPY